MDRSTSRTLPLIDETLEVAKVEVDRGGYRLVKRVETEERLVDEPLRSERVEIERRPIGRTLTGSELPLMRHEGDTLIVPVVREVLVLEKRLVLVEEVRITRIHGVQRSPQRVSLRTETIDIERLAADAPSTPDLS